MFSALPHAVGLLRSDCAEFTRISAYRNKLNNIVREKNGVMLEYCCAFSCDVFYRCKRKTTDYIYLENDHTHSANQRREFSCSILSGITSISMLYIEHTNDI